MIRDKKRFRVEEIDGEHYIRVLIHENLTDDEKRHRNPKRLWLKNEQGRRLSLKDYQIKPNRHKRSEPEMLKLIEADVEKVYQRHGLNQPVKEDLNELIPSDRMKITEAFELYYKHLESTASKRTFQEREKDTLKNYRHALKWYLKIFKNHRLDKFPPGVRADFQTKLAALKIKDKKNKNLAPMTIRKHAIALNSFFSLDFRAGTESRGPGCFRDAI